MKDSLALAGRQLCYEVLAVCERRQKLLLKARRSSDMTEGVLAKRVYDVMVHAESLQRGSTCIRSGERHLAR